MPPSSKPAAKPASARGSRPPSARNASPARKAGAKSGKPAPKKKAKKASGGEGSAVAAAPGEALEEIAEAGGEEEEEEQPQEEQPQQPEDTVMAPAAEQAAAPEPSAAAAAAVTLPPVLSPAQQLLALLPNLRELERGARSAAQALPRPLRLFSLEQAEEKVTDLLALLTPDEVLELSPTIATLLDAGAPGFFRGERGDAGVLVANAAKSTLARASADLASLRASGDVPTCASLWVPSRDGDAAELSRLLELGPWTIDEPRPGEYTSALQVACTSGNVDCVRLLLDAGAIFRDADFALASESGQPGNPHVCAGILAGSGITEAPVGQASGSSAAAVPRDAYAEILDLLTAHATFANGQADRDLVVRTRAAFAPAAALPEAVGALDIGDPAAAAQATSS